MSTTQQAPPAEAVEEQMGKIVTELGPRWECCSPPGHPERPVGGTGRSRPLTTAEGAWAARRSRRHRRGRGALVRELAAAAGFGRRDDSLAGSPGPVVLRC